MVLPDLNPSDNRKYGRMHACYLAPLFLLLAEAQGFAKSKKAFTIILADTIGFYALDSARGS
jgi:hypothetical protein